MGSSSLAPVFVTIAFIEIPSFALIIDLFYRSLTPTPLPALLILLNLVTIALMFRCTCTDPGIVPQTVNNYQTDSQLLQLPAVNHSLISDRNFLIGSPSGLPLTVYQKYCTQCHIYRPLRTIHCRTCNHCIERYDHHCPWLGICIGKYNYPHFISFLSSLTVLSLLGTFVSLFIIIEKTQNKDPITSYILEIVVGLLAGGFGIGLIKLLFYHLTLAHNRLTTNEDLKQTYSPIEGSIPFPRCQSTHPPLLDPKGTLIRSDDIEMSFQQRSSIHSRKGHRYSTLVSGRDSVLNSLVDAQL